MEISEQPQQNRRRSQRREANKKKKEEQAQRQRQQNSSIQMCIEPQEEAKQSEQLQIMNERPQNPILQFPRNVPQRMLLPHEMQRTGENKVAPSAFLQKIPNRNVLRDFFINHCGLYCPPLRDMSKKFIALILKEQKHLLRLKDVKHVVNAPNFAEFSTERIWASIRNMDNAQNILKYFPDFTGKVLPNKQYLLDVLNTVEPGLIIKTLKDMKKLREQKEIEECPILMSNFFKGKLDEFVSITSNERLTGIGNILQREFKTCNICLNSLRPSQQKLKYTCGKHQGHKNCVTSFNRSLQNPKYSCPMRCPNPNYQGE